MRARLPAYAGDDEPTGAARRHLARCPSCSEELGRYRAMMGSLAALETQTFAPPPSLVSALLAIPGTGRLNELRSHLTRNRRAYASGAAAAVALAGAAGAVAWRSRRRALVPA